MKVALILAVAIGASAPVYAKSSGRTAFNDGLTQAKALLAQGNRKLALEHLDKLLGQARSKSEQKEILSKRKLFAEQFLTTEAFQKFQEAKGLAETERWEECLRELDSLGEKDQDNLLVLKTRGTCEFSAKQYEPAAVTFKRILAVDPGDVSVGFALVRLALAQNRASEAIVLLNSVSPLSSREIEQHAILKAKALEVLEKSQQAAEVLRDDQEKHLDHIEVIHALGMLYSRVPGHDWQARKTFSLFLTRCKRLSEAELKSRHLDKLVPEAQAMLSTIDKKLGI